VYNKTKEVGFLTSLSLYIYIYILLQQAPGALVWMTKKTGVLSQKLLMCHIGRLHTYETLRNRLLVSFSTNCVYDIAIAVGMHVQGRVLK
jgi:hypothetical protein